MPTPPAGGGSTSKKKRAGNSDDDYFEPDEEELEEERKLDPPTFTAYEYLVLCATDHTTHLQTVFSNLYYTYQRGQTTGA